MQTYRTSKGEISKGKYDFNEPVEVTVPVKRTS